MTTTSTTFKETLSAADLLEEFHSLSKKPVKRFTRSTNDAATAFFSKDFLTIADFVAPIGEILIVAISARPERETSVHNFITSSLHHGKKTPGRTGRLFVRKNETVGQFLNRLDP